MLKILYLAKRLTLHIMNLFWDAYYHSVSLFRYLGKISRADAEALLLRSGNVDGAFLVRQSESSPGDFSISVRLVNCLPCASNAPSRIKISKLLKGC